MDVEAAVIQIGDYQGWHGRWRWLRRWHHLDGLLDHSGDLLSHALGFKFNCCFGSSFGAHE
jgi:hypothetical protein